MPTAAVWRELAWLYLVSEVAVLVGLILLLRGTPTAQRWIGIACVLTWATPLIVHFSSRVTGVPMTPASWPVHVTSRLLGISYIVLRLVWLRRLALTESTKRLAALALALESCIAGVSFVSSLIFLSSGQVVLNFMATGPAWLAIMWAVVVAGVGCLTPIVIARVLSETVADNHRQDKYELMPSPTAF